MTWTVYITGWLQLARQLSSKFTQNSNLQPYTCAYGSKFQKKNRISSRFFSEKKWGNSVSFRISGKNGFLEKSWGCGDGRLSKHINGFWKILSHIKGNIFFLEQILKYPYKIVNIMISSPYWQISNDDNNRFLYLSF